MPKPKHPEAPPSIRVSLQSRQAVLPGESAEDYEQGLNNTLTQMDAKTHMQRHLAHAIFDCTWWIRRYERDRISTIVVAMAKCINAPGPSMGLSDQQAQVAQALMANDWQDPLLQVQMDMHGYTPETLLQAAVEQSMERLVEVDRQIFLRVKTMLGMEAAYEKLSHRRLQGERLRLETERMRRDLSAIDVQAVDKANAAQAAPRP